MSLEDQPRARRGSKSPEKSRNRSASAGSATNARRLRSRRQRRFEKGARVNPRRRSAMGRGWPATGGSTGRWEVSPHLYLVSANGNRPRTRSFPIRRLRGIRTGSRVNSSSQLLQIQSRDPQITEHGRSVRKVRDQTTRISSMIDWRCISALARKRTNIV